MRAVELASNLPQTSRFILAVEPAARWTDELAYLAMINHRLDVVAWAVNWQNAGKDKQLAKQRAMPKEDYLPKDLKARFDELERAKKRDEEGLQENTVEQLDDILSRPRRASTKNIDTQ